MRGSLLFFMVTAAATVFLTCSDLGGIGHEGEARISGQLVFQDGTPAAETQVMLFPDDYDPIKNTREVSAEGTDPQGNYRFLRVSPGSYTLLAIHASSRTRTLISGIRVTGNALTVLPPHTLGVTGTMKVFLPSDVSSTTGYIYFPGTALFTFLNNRTDFVLIDSVPPGIIPEVAYSSTSETTMSTIRYNVLVPSCDTAVVRKPGWKYAQRIQLNTSQSGAGVSGNVTHFPLCIRISPENFVFNQAKAGGTDIRFTKMDDITLPYEIERWDTVEQQAEIWVKVDTIYGNNDTQAIMMYWGNAVAADASDNAAVFDTADGFQGVWHLNEAGNADARDATGNRFDGHAFQMPGTSLAVGMIGNARVFDGNSSYIAVPNTASGKLNFPDDGYFSISAWAYVDTFDNEYRTIAGKGHQQYFLQLTYFPLNRPQWEFSTFSNAENWRMSTSSAVEKQWVLLTGVRQGNVQYLYCNGELVDATSDVYDHGISRGASEDFLIGRFMNEATFPANFGYCYFKGRIDEVRVSSVARNADWIRLSYMNQRSDDKVVQFK